MGLLDESLLKVDGGLRGMSSTDPLKAFSDTVRGDFGVDVEENLVHGSDYFSPLTMNTPFFLINRIAQMTKNNMGLITEFG